MPDKTYDLTPPEWIHERAGHYLDYADSYRIICQVLLDLEYLEEPFYSERRILPILSLFRQYVELELKGFLLKIDETKKFGNIKHDLEKALNEIKELNSKFQISKDVEAFIIFINKLDIAGESFRYPENLNGNMYFKDVNKYYNEIGKLSALYPKVNQTIHELETNENIFRK